MKAKAAFAVFLGLPAIGLGACTDANTYGPQKFDSAQWKAADDVRDSARCDMVDDLIDNVGLEGRSRAEVVRMLGEPVTQDGYPDFYFLCAVMIDPRILEIEWENDRVNKATVRDT